MGVTILAVLAIIAGIFGLLGAFALLLGGAVIAGSDGGTGLGTLALLIGLAFLVLSILELAFGFGAWTLKPWAWTLGIASQVLSLILSVIYIATGSSIGSQIVSIIIAAVILYYLFTPPVRQAFGKA
jgi:uncharacterized membrane protein HdeD (DUF308 family)